MSEKSKTLQVGVELCYLNLCCLNSALEVAAFLISAVILAVLVVGMSVVMLKGFFILFSWFEIVSIN